MRPDRLVMKSSAQSAPPKAQLVAPEVEMVTRSNSAPSGE
jgi:hypothetical protein